MKNVSLKIDDSIFVELEKILVQSKQPRNRYINEALDHYNRLQKRKLLEKRLKEESQLVQRESMAVGAAFEKIAYAD